MINLATQQPRHSVSVAGVITDDHGRALLIQRADNHRWEPPGGVLELGESITDGVRREVHEETGLVCRLVALLGETRYEDRRGRPKVVCYWLMEPDRVDPFVPNDEVDQLRWLDADGAATLLTYPHDRELLDRLPRGRRRT